MLLPMYYRDSAWARYKYRYTVTDLLVTVSDTILYGHGVCSQYGKEIIRPYRPDRVLPEKSAYAVLMCVCTASTPWCVFIVILLYHRCTVPYN